MTFDLFFKDSSIPEKIKKVLRQFLTSYQQALAEDGISALPYMPLLSTYLELVKEQCDHPYPFQPFHKQVRAPFDYYKFGRDFVRPLIDLDSSTVSGLSELDKIEELLKKQSNVIFFANHQIEADPLVISILLEKTHPKLGAELISVAGERVLTDRLAIPFSMGCNLICIYSKRYIDHPPEEKHKKQLHNKRAMELMSELLSEGGKSIYVAPSGGRDRPNANGIVEVTPFDPQSIEMFYLMAKKASKPTYFYPMALSTYALLPPPETVKIELGENRKTKRGAAHLAFGAQIDMEHFPDSKNSDKYVRRKSRADYIWNLVKKDYASFPGVSS